MSECSLINSDDDRSDIVTIIFVMLDMRCVTHWESSRLPTPANDSLLIDLRGFQVCDDFWIFFVYILVDHVHLNVKLSGWDVGSESWAQGMDWGEEKTHKQGEQRGRAHLVRESR